MTPRISPVISPIMSVFKFSLLLLLLLLLWLLLLLSPGEGTVGGVILTLFVAVENMNKRDVDKIFTLDQITTSENPPPNFLRQVTRLIVLPSLCSSLCHSNAILHIDPFMYRSVGWSVFIPTRITPQTLTTHYRIFHMSSFQRT